MADVAPRLTGQDLEHELERLLEIERFDPPEAFTEQALLSDPAVYERAARDPEGWWAEQAATASTGPSRGRRCSTGRTRRLRSGSWAGS